MLAHFMKVAGMTQLTASPKPASPAPAGLLRPSDFLMNLIVSILAPIFLGVTGGDVNLARMAAIQAVNTYRVRHCADLIAVALIVAYGLAALNSLSLSFGEEVSLSMVLRLRNNANALNRSAEQNRRAMRRHVEPDVTEMMAPPEPPALPETPADAPEAEPFLSDAAEALLAAEARDRLSGPRPQAAAEPVAPAADPVAETAGDAASEKRLREMWAIAMVKDAADITAGLPGLPPTERGAASVRAGMLASTANQLLTGGDGPGVGFRLAPGKVTGSRVRPGGGDGGLCGPGG